jgi:hypothetical protein
VPGTIFSAPQHNRSLYGIKIQEVSTMNQVEDVTVVLSPSHKYNFHSSVLTRNSSLFADLLDERFSAQLCAKAKNTGLKIRWMIELREILSDAFPGGKLERLVSIDAFSGFDQKNYAS